MLHYFREEMNEFEYIVNCAGEIRRVQIIYSKEAEDGLDVEATRATADFYATIT